MDYTVNNVNDGEGICNEAPKGDFYYGRITTVTGAGTILTVTSGYAGGAALAVPVLYYGNLCVYITSGTGRGQMRNVLSVTPASNTITLTQAFTITPDSTSTFSLFAPLQYFTVYHNTLNDCAQGILPYGQQYDTVVADAHPQALNSRREIGTTNADVTASPVLSEA